MRTGVKVDASYNSENRRELVNHVADLLKSGEVCGKVVLIVWKHSSIGHLAHKLGCGPLEGKLSLHATPETVNFSEVKPVTHPCSIALSQTPIHLRRLSFGLQGQEF